MRRISKAAVVVAASSISLLGAAGFASAEVATNPSASAGVSSPPAANPSAPADNGSKGGDKTETGTPPATGAASSDKPGGGDQTGPGTSDHCTPMTGDPAKDKVAVDIQGLNGSQIVAGGAAVPFKVVVTNHTGETLQQPALLIAIAAENADWSKSAPILSFKDGHGVWSQAPVEWDAADMLWVTAAEAGPLPDNSSATLDAKLAFPVGTPAGTGVNIEIATDAGCPGPEGIGTPLGVGQAYFDVVAGGSHTNPAGHTTSAPSKAPKPIDFGKVTPSATGTAPVTVTSLAHTGADGTPTLAIVGGCVVVAGAGLVFFGRRKLRGSHSA